jgi:hypothetical protein
MCTGRLQRMTTLAAARTDYKNQPWEVEAFELEDPLYELYLKNS